MRWALTLDDTTDSTALAEALGRAGVIIDDASPPVPMSGGEIVVYAAGPDPLPDGIPETSGIKKIHRLSDMTLY